MKTSLTRIIVGTLITLLGIGFLLENFNIVNLDGVLQTWWPLIVIIGGLGALASNIRQPIFPILFIAFGTLLQLRALDIVEFDVFGLIWPAIVIGLGLSILLRHSGFEDRNVTSEDKNDLMAFLSGISSLNKSSDYKGGKATAVFGGIELNLSEAQIKDKATLDVFTFCGGLELRVPDEWNVVVSGMPIMGGWEDKTRKSTAKNPRTLVVNATCVMGGLEIKN